MQVKIKFLKRLTMANFSSIIQRAAENTIVWASCMQLGFTTQKKNQCGLKPKIGEMDQNSRNINKLVAILLKNVAKRYCVTVSSLATMT